ncbi:MAG: SEC-C domain-containing protein [Myxococcales bacterium]|nr:SEC-C domain-containing protein [Myxococcales bacterium]
MAVDLTRIRAIKDSEWSDEAIRAAIGACDADRAAELAFARALAGREVDARLVAEILPGVRSMGVAIALLGLASGDRAAAWMELVEQRRIPDLRSALDVELLALRAAHRDGAPPAEVARACRRIARLDLDADAGALLYTFATSLGDPALSKLVADLRDVVDDDLSREFILSVKRLEAKALRQQLESLPEVPDATPPPAAFTVRAAPSVGRNEPCPCGSGQKYKKCCADKDAQQTGSPIRGMSWDDYLTRGADRMSQEDIDRLTLRDLARVDLGKLADLPLITAFRRFVVELAWQRAALVLDEWARRHGAPEADEHRVELIMSALQHERVDIAAAEIAKVANPADVAIESLEVALRAPPSGVLAALEAQCAATLRKEPTTEVVDLALGVLHALPALGILVARGAVGPGTLDNQFIGEDIETARDQLGLPPGDRVWDVIAALEESDEDDDEETDGEAKQLATNLRVTSARVDELEQQLARAQKELTQRKVTPAASAAAAVPADRDRERELRAKIDELKSLVSEGNEERGELRRQLAAQSRATRAAAPEARAEVEAEHDEGEDVAPPRGISIPVVSRRVQDALADAPAAVAAEMLKLLGGLAAGDGFTWRGTKPAQDMPRPVLMARVGIHYRLLFRIEDGMLHTLDFVTRENLDVTLKRLRTTKA